MEFTPFADKEELAKLQKERMELIDSLDDYSIGHEEKQFILRKINNITEKLLHKARYIKDIK